MLPTWLDTVIKAWPAGRSSAAARCWPPSTRVRLVPCRKGGRRRPRLPAPGCAAGCRRPTQRPRSPRHPGQWRQRRQEPECRHHRAPRAACAVLAPPPRLRLEPGRPGGTVAGAVCPHLWGGTRPSLASLPRACGRSSLFVWPAGRSSFAVAAKVVLGVPSFLVLTAVRTRGCSRTPCTPLHRPPWCQAGGLQAVVQATQQRCSTLACVCVCVCVCVRACVGKGKGEGAAECGAPGVAAPAAHAAAAAAQPPPPPKTRRPLRGAFI